MNEISPDTIKGKRWVGSFYIEGKESGRRRRTRMRGYAVGLGRRPEGVIMLCNASTFAATVHRRLKVKEKPRNGSNCGTERRRRPKVVKRL
ncbi:hypothetical protein Y032_0890g2884 [Ancylostoma ceylanicum]|uniref:Uncharacterized protein n=1 Tax=Ancylostoma ceylanicum TaxID=53326 RepID=A0A016WA70_9BILA|nr:hypothetical protein Y032_0890g2884 [Ancylostoma ceylanicum]